MALELPNPKELETIIKLCRKLGVESIEVGGVKVVLADQPEKHRKPYTKKKDKTDAADPVSFDDMSPEQKLFWSVGDASFDHSTAPTTGE